eukprot:SAG25_NODE_9875_length_354_cov_1.180392_1_plen_82_part_10
MYFGSRTTVCVTGRTKLDKLVLSTIAVVGCTALVSIPLKTWADDDNDSAAIKFNNGARIGLAVVYVAWNSIILLPSLWMQFQ